MKDKEVPKLLCQDSNPVQTPLNPDLLLMMQAIEQNSVAIMITDPSGNIEYANPWFSKLTGYSPDELTGKNNRIFKSGFHTAEFYKSMWDTILEGKRWIGEIYNKKKNGELHWIKGTISPIISNGKITHFVAVKEDITAFKKLESTQRFIYDISKISFTGITLKDYLKKIHFGLSNLLSAENFYIALYDKTSGLYSFAYHVDQYDEVDENNQVDLSLTLTDYVRKHGKGMLVTEDLDKELRDSGEVNLYGSPSPIWVGAPLLDSSNNEVIGVIALQDYNNSTTYSSEDLSTLEIIASQIGQFIDRVKRMEDLHLAKERAEESDRLKSAFLANMSHEIRTPMNGILGFTELLTDPALTSEEHDNYIQIIMKSGQRMLDTVNDIIEISKIETGLSEITWATVDIISELNDLYHFFLREAWKKHINLKLNSELNHLYIKTDRNKLLSVFTNLIKNAIKFTSDGEIAIQVGLKEDQVYFEVADSGIGIPVEKLDAIFNRFEQGDVAMSRGYEGSGLGLAISKAYVELLGGKIHVESELNHGSVFKLTIPYIRVEREDLPFTASHNPISSYPEKKLCILIAEDDHTSFLYLQMILKTLPCEIIHALTGRDALDYYIHYQEKIDLILMDIKMPEMDGYTATREIRKINNSVPIVAQTAFSLAGDMEKALQAGCNYYLPKPIKKADLMHILQQISAEAHR